MNYTNLIRAEQLYHQNRYSESEKILLQLITDENFAQDARYLLVLNYTQTNRLKEARAIASQGISEQPTDARFPFLFALIEIEDQQYNKAKEFIKVAQTLEPENASLYGIESNIELYLANLEKALVLAEQGLTLDPENSICLTAKAQAQTKLLNHTDANKIFSQLLSDNPEDDDTHAQLGYSLLQQNQHKKALIHFREALRLNPNNQLAISGIKESIKARFFLYRWFLQYSFWLSRKSSQFQFGFIIGAYILYRVLLGISQNNPEIAIFLNPLLAFYVLFAVSSWIIIPVSNIFLRLNKFGKYALTKIESVISVLVGISLLISITTYILCILYPDTIKLFVPVYFLLLSLPMGVMNILYDKRVLKKFLYFLLTVYFIGFIGLVLTLAGKESIVNFIYILGIVGSQFYANYLISHKK